jgi:hypothetical protein
MQAMAVPNPFEPSSGFDVVPLGGRPPFTFTPEPSPPNPPGVSVDGFGHVSVPLDTPPGTRVAVVVTDSSDPPQSVSVPSDSL